MAFSFEGYNDLQRKDDPRFVKYLVEISEQKDGEMVRK